MKIKDRFKLALIDENPTFVSFLALCPTLGITNSLDNAIGMGLSVIFVLIMSNVTISLIRKIVPSEIRIPVYITIIATLVTVLEMVIETFFPAIYVSLGIFLPLIVVNCIILGRAEAYASKNTVKNSAIDGLVMGFAFLVSLSALAMFRELLGTGGISMLGIQLFTEEQSVSILAQSGGAFLSLGILSWWFNEKKQEYDKKKKLKERG